MTNHVDDRPLIDVKALIEKIKKELAEMGITYEA